MQDLNTHQTENDRLVKEINVTNFSNKPVPIKPRAVNRFRNHTGKKKHIACVAGAKRGGGGDLSVLKTLTGSLAGKSSKRHKTRFRLLSPA